MVGVVSIPAGTIGVTPSSGFVAWCIRKITRSPVAHAFIATGWGDEIIEADPHGARRNHSRSYRTVYWCDRIASALNDAERAKVVEYAKAHIGTPYSWVDDAEIGFVDMFGRAPRWMRRRLRSDRTLMCSQLCAAAYRAAGVVLYPNRVDGSIAPGDLYALEQHLTAAGVAAQ